MDYIRHTITGNNLPIKTAQKTIDFIRQMSQIEMYDATETRRHGVLDTATDTFVDDADLSSIEHLIKEMPRRFITTQSFGINVSFSNGSNGGYTTTFIKHSKGCQLFGECLSVTQNCHTDSDRKKALNDYLFGIYVSETIQKHLLPSIKIVDDTFYHKSKPSRETLKSWKFNDSNRGTTFLRDFDNLDNHNLPHLLDYCGWSQSLVFPSNTNGQSARLNLLLDTLSDTPNEYNYIRHLRKLCDMAIAYIQANNE